MSTCRVNAYSACIFLVKEGEICCFFHCGWIPFQFVNVFHFYWPPFLLRVQLWSSPLSMLVTNSPLWNSSFMTKRVSNTQDVPCESYNKTSYSKLLLSLYRLLFYPYSVTIVYSIVYSFCSPSLLLFPQTSFSSQPFCNRRLFSYGTAVQGGQLDELTAEDMFQTASSCPWSQWGFGLETGFFLSSSLRSAWLGEKKVGEGLVYLVVDTRAELKAWTLITVVTQLKGGSGPGYRSGLKYLQCVSSCETFHHYILPHHLFQGHRKKDKLHFTSVRAFFDSGLLKQKHQQLLKNEGPFFQKGLNNWLP